MPASQNVARWPALLGSGIPPASCIHATLKVQPYYLPDQAAAQIRRLKYQGMAVSAYAAQPAQSSGVIQLACGFAYESELFRVRGGDAELGLA